MLSRKQLEKRKTPRTIISDEGTIALSGPAFRISEISWDRLLIPEHSLTLSCVILPEETVRKHTGKCFDCSGSLMLFEIDMQKATKIMLCQNCGLFHYYKKDFIGNYKLNRVSKTPDLGK